jgi:hypothetical protein
MEKEKSNPSINEFDQAFDRQTTYDSDSKSYTAKCAVCGKAHTQKKRLFSGKRGSLAKIRLHFNYCQTCGRWICNDCYLVDDGNANCIGICTDCAKDRGITGVTNAQFDALWPEIDRRRRERYVAMKRQRQNSGAETQK